VVWIHIQEDLGSCLNAAESLQIEVIQDENEENTDRHPHPEEAKEAREDQVRLWKDSQLGASQECVRLEIESEVQPAQRRLPLPGVCQGKGPPAGENTVSELSSELPTITVGGLPGSGKSTFAKLLSEELGVEYLGAGQIFREMAAKRGMTLVEFSRLAEEDHEIDRQLDRSQTEMARGRDVVVDSRLSAWMVEDPDLKICLTAEFKERARRVADRDSVPMEEAIRLVSEREKSERRRYSEIHGIDIGDVEVYDLTVNSGKYLPEEILKIVREALGIVQGKET
jgi:cytidylate kinase